MTCLRTSKPTAPSSGRLHRAADRRVLAGQAGDHPEEHQEVRGEAEQDAQQAQEELRPALVGQTDEGQQVRGESGRRAGDREGPHQRDPEAEQRGEVEQQPLRQRRRFRRLRPLLRQRLAQVRHPPDARVERSEQAERGHRVPLGDRLVDDRVDRVGQVRRQGRVDRVTDLVQQVRVEEQHVTGDRERDHQQRHQGQDREEGDRRRVVVAVVVGVARRRPGRGGRATGSGPATARAWSAWRRRPCARPHATSAATRSDAARPTQPDRPRPGPIQRSRGAPHRCAGGRNPIFS